MEKKEFYRHYLPHFQQPGQAYFVTWCLKNAVPRKALLTYTKKMEMLKSQISSLGASGSANSDSPIFDSNRVFNYRDYKSQDPIWKPEALVIEKLKQDYYAARRKYIKAYDNLLFAKEKHKVQIEVDLYATVYNLKRLINIENMQDLIHKVEKYSWKVA